jgi:hypothetical protein
MNTAKGQNATSRSHQFTASQQDLPGLDANDAGLQLIVITNGSLLPQNAIVNISAITGLFRKFRP